MTTRDLPFEFTSDLELRSLQDGDLVEVAPAVDWCPACTTRLQAYKTSQRRTVKLLDKDIILVSHQKYCPNDACPALERDERTGKKRPVIVESPLLPTIVMPSRQHGLEVILEVGTRYLKQPRPMHCLREEFLAEYGRSPSLSSLYRFKDDYEALCMGVVAEHHEDITAALHRQPAFIVIVDATQSFGKVKFYRAIDWLSGLYLGGIVVPEGNTTNVRQWLDRLHERFQFRDGIVSDGEAALHGSKATVEDGVPHQDCWQHVLTNIQEALMKEWRTDVKHVLQKLKYRKVLLKIRQQLEALDLEAWPPHGVTLRDLIDVLLTPARGGANFEEPLFVTLTRFFQARTVLDQWERSIKGQLGAILQDDPLFQELRELKTRLSPAERNRYFTLHIFQDDPFFRAFQAVQQFIARACRQITAAGLLSRHRALWKEFTALRSLVLEAVIRRNEQTLRGWADKEPQTLSEQVLRDRLQQNTKRARKELNAITPSWRGWSFKGKEPELPWEERFQQLWQRLLTRWRRKGRRDAAFLKAAAILERQEAHLTVFVRHPVMPLSNQVIETDHGRLKECWRKSAGRLEAPYMLEYHGHPLSMARNLYQGDHVPSPLEILGFSREVIHSWMVSCSQRAFQDAKREMERFRDRRRWHLRASRQSLTEVFTDGAAQWLEWTVTSLRKWLAEQGRLPGNASLHAAPLSSIGEQSINSDLITA